MNKAPQSSISGSVSSHVDSPAREPRAFSFLKPRMLTVAPPDLDPVGRSVLAARAADYVPSIARAVVDHSIALHNEQGRRIGNRQPIQLSMLNRRRRAARAWLQSVVAGSVDSATLHAVATQWLPTLAGQGRDGVTVRDAVRSCVEFARGSITALLFEQPEDNLLAGARALHALDTTLSVHLSAAEAALAS